MIYVADLNYIMLLFDVGLGWVGLGWVTIDYISCGLCWVGSVKSWVGLGCVTENGPTSMSAVETFPQRLVCRENLKTSCNPYS